jgi:hypothetical protein
VEAIWVEWDEGRVRLSANIQERGFVHIQEKERGPEGERFWEVVDNSVVGTR